MYVIHMADARVMEVENNTSTEEKPRESASGEPERRPGAEHQTLTGGLKKIQDMMDEMPKMQKRNAVLSLEASAKVAKEAGQEDHFAGAW